MFEKIPKVQTDSRELNQAQDNILSGVNLAFDYLRDVEAQGPILLSPDGSRWRLVVANNGTLSATKL